jgi:glycosyltransferase involved in cell wall biosynthesis
MIAPLFMGAGQQNKVLEAMAMGVPVITTELVNNAIGAKVGDELLVASSAEEFADQAVRLLEDGELYGRVSASALEFVRRTFDWDAVGVRLASILGLQDEPGREIPGAT